MSTGRLGRTARALVLVGTVPVLVSGCGFYPPDHAPLPGLGGRGDGHYTITVELPDAENLVQNQDVRFNDVEVGNVERITFDDWHAKATVQLDGDVKLPANTTAKVAQKSLLGAEYLELDAPASAPDSRMLADGGVIPLAQSGHVPETEEVLAALSTVLNGGGLNQLATINSELSQALGGHEQQAKELIHTLSDFAGTLDARKSDITHAIDGIDRLSTSLNQNSATVAKAVDQIPAGLAEIDAQRKDLVDALDATGKLGDTVKDVVHSSKDDLVDNLRHLEPVLKKLADSGNNLTDSISGALTLPFSANTSFPTVFRGDFGNLFAIFDVQPIDLLRNFGVIPAGMPMSAVSMIAGLPPLGAGLKSGNPLVTPFSKLPAAKSGVGSAPLGGGLLPGRHPDAPRSSGGGLLGPLNGGR